MSEQKAPVEKQIEQLHHMMSQVITIMELRHSIINEIISRLDALERAGNDKERTN